ncbi:MAG: sigma-54-dependent Fis family transcriptional regulator [Myxococcaceae bacterium]|nr:sigma-54-dependent Fis family transcriptional regulator [Myxococcaceae bacterium]
MSCETPFESGGQLCRVCRGNKPIGGARFCSRLVVKSAPMQALLPRMATVANTDASVVLRGESGSGKEVIARAIHANSARRAKPFVAVNCAALPSELLESELFGHARGAFTGANSARKGLFETADGGTLFLDEIAEMPLALQAKLLRALQDGEIRRVGESQPFQVDVRLLCATHQHLQTSVQEGRFREDLYFRLKVFTLVVPPLRERREDIPLLADIFLELENHATRRITPLAMKALLAYQWPGNVRELANAMKHGAVLSGQSDVDLEHLPEELAERMPSVAPIRAPALSSSPALLESLAQVERRHITDVLRACGGKSSDAARVLGIGRTTLWRKMKEYGLAEG